MKIIINESQLRLIVENEGKDNLINFTPFYNSADPNDWDDMFLHLNKKKGGIYDGYYIDGNIDIRNSEIKEFKHLVRVKGHLKAYGSKIEDLGKLRRVDRGLTLSNTKNLKSLGKTSPEFSEENFKIYVTDFLMIYGTGLSDEEIKKIKYGWLSKSQYGN